MTIKIRFEWFVICPHCQYEHSAINTSLNNYNCSVCGNFFNSSPNFRAKNQREIVISK